MHTLRLGADPDAVGGAGGATIALQASATALNIGDVVCQTTVAQRVDKSNVAANGKFFVGVVVGGGSTRGVDAPFYNVASVGLQAVSGAGKSAVVQVTGIANVVAGAAVTPQQQLMLDTATAGRVIPGVVAGQIVGIALTAAAGAGSVFQMLIQPR